MDEMQPKFSWKELNLNVYHYIQYKNRHFYALYLVVDVEFYPNLHFLTHQPNEPSGKNTYKAIPFFNYLYLDMPIKFYHFNACFKLKQGLNTIG